MLKKQAPPMKTQKTLSQGKQKALLYIGITTLLVLGAFDAHSMNITDDELIFETNHSGKIEAEFADVLVMNTLNFTPPPAPAPPPAPEPDTNTHNNSGGGVRDSVAENKDNKYNASNWILENAYASLIEEREKNKASEEDQKNEEAYQEYLSSAPKEEITESSSQEIQDTKNTEENVQEGELKNTNKTNGSESRGIESENKEETIIIVEQKSTDQSETEPEINKTGNPTEKCEYIQNTHQYFLSMESDEEIEYEEMTRDISIANNMTVRFLIISQLLMLLLIILKHGKKEDKKKNVIKPKKAKK